jgi:hypothetical protein
MQEYGRIRIFYKASREVNKEPALKSRHAGRLVMNGMPRTLATRFEVGRIQLVKIWVLQIH